MNGTSHVQIWDMTFKFAIVLFISLIKTFRESFTVDKVVTTCALHTFIMYI